MPDFNGPVAVFMMASLHLMTDAENPHAVLVESFFDGFELVLPGVVNINSWPVPIPEYAAEDRALLYGG